MLSRDMIALRTVYYFHEISVIGTMTDIIRDLLEETVIDHYLVIDQRSKSRQWERESNMIFAGKGRMQQSHFNRVHDMATWFLVLQSR